MQRTTTFLRPGRARTPRLLSALAAAWVLWVPIAAQAQFQHVYGSGSGGEAGYAIVQVSDGGYMAVGSHTDAASGTTDGYAVRTDAAGTTIWDKVFQFGPQQNIALNDVKECANGDFVIVGETSTTLSCATGCTNMIVMRIDANGTIRWERTIGDHYLSYIGKGIVEAQFGNGGTTHAGDIVVAGYDFDYNNQGYDGILERFDADGNSIWARRYDIDPNDPSSTLLLTSIDEARVWPNVGDIVAAGQVYIPSTGVDVLVLRVDGASGEFGAAPQGAGAFAGPRNDHAFSITEIRNGLYAGDLVTTGTTSSRTPPFGYEVLMVETRPDPCDAAGQRADQFFGDNWLAGDFGYCVREITDPALGTPGDVIVAGMGRRPAWAPDQATLVEVQAGTMIPIGQIDAYGSPGGVEIACGVAECTSAHGSPGFVLTGSTSASPLGLYMVRTDAALQTPCNHEQFAPNPDVAGLTHTCLSITPSIPDFNIICGIQSLATDWANDICTLPDAAPRINTGAPALAQATSASDAVTSFPNPVRNGDEVTIDVTSEAAGSVHVVVSDIRGRDVADRTIDAEAGQTNLHMSTAGWNPGVYLVRIDAGTTTRTGRITVVPR